MSTPAEPPVDPWATPAPGGTPPAGSGREPQFPPSDPTIPIGGLAPGPPSEPYLGDTQPGPYGPPAGQYGQPAGQYGQPAGQYGAPGAYGPAYGTPAPPSAGNGLGTAALVLGILAVLSGVFLIGALFGVVAIVLGIVGRGRARRGRATNGGVALSGALLGATGVAIAAGVVVLVFAVFANPIADYRRCLDRAGSDVSAQQTCADDLRQRFTDRLR